MGLIKALMDTVGGGLADQWLEVIEADNMANSTLMAGGVKVRRDDPRGSNRKGTQDTVSNGSIIHVYENQFMMLIDGGKVVDYTAEPGYFKVDNSAVPSLFNGQFGDTFKEVFSRIKFGGITPFKQQVVFVNMQEIPNIKFGTPAPVGYYDKTLDLDLQLRSHGTFTLKILNPLKFYVEVAPKNGEIVDFGPDMEIDSVSGSIKQTLLSEFLGEFQAALNRVSNDNIRVTQVMSQGPAITKYMREAMDEDWTNIRGLEVLSVGINSITLNEDSQAIINERSRAAAYRDPNMLNAYMGTAVARGIESAGSNEGGSTNAFLGMGMGMQNSGIGEFMHGNQQMAQQHTSQEQHTHQPTQDGWKCDCGTVNKGKFCTECGKQHEIPSGWKCGCGAQNKGKFCTECGKPMPVNRVCTKCGNDKFELSDKFCPECGNAL